MEDKDIAAAESVQAARMRMDIEADNATNVDIFYLFLAMSFHFTSFTSIPCMALEDTSTDTLLENMDILAWHIRSKDPSIPCHKACRVAYTRILVRKRCMAADIHTMDRSTTIYESLDRILCPILCPILDRIPILFRIQVSGSCIRELDSLHSIRLLFQSWVLSPKVLFYLPTAFIFHLYFVFMHTFNYVIMHRNI